MDLSKEKKNLMGAGTMVLLVAVLFVGAKFINEVKSNKYIGAGMAGQATNIITVTGEGKVDAVPDIASINFTIESSKATQVESSNEVNAKTKTIVDGLKAQEIDEKDIKTDGYNSYPKYSNEICPMYGGMPCRTESKIIGYNVSQNITVKVRKVDNASTVIDSINKIGVTNMSGPNFTFDDPSKIQNDARGLAITDAKTKADVLAKQLGVKLVRITSFNDNNGGGYPMPMYANAKSDMMVSAAPVASEIPKGQNTVTSNVTITYEIK